MVKTRLNDYGEFWEGGLKSRIRPYLPRSCKKTSAVNNPNKRINIRKGRKFGNIPKKPSGATVKFALPQPQSATLNGQTNFVSGLVLLTSARGRRKFKKQLASSSNGPTSFQLQNGAAKTATSYTICKACWPNGLPAGEAPPKNWVGSNYCKFATNTPVPVPFFTKAAS